MKTLCKFCSAVVLTLTLATVALAGDIHTTVAPPSAPSQGEMQNGVAGYIPNGSSEAAADDSVAAGVLGLVLDVLSLL